MQSVPSTQNMINDVFLNNQKSFIAVNYLSGLS